MWNCIAEIQLPKDSQGAHSFSECRDGTEIKPEPAVLGKCVR